MSRLASSSSLQDSDTRSLAPARARVLQSIGGRILYIAELLQGRIPVSLGRQVTPSNPQGRIGIDHSGPPWGSAFRHPMMTMGGCIEDVSGDAVGQRIVGTFSQGNPLIIPIRLYVRPFASSAGAPYSRAYVTARVARVSGSGSVDFDVTCRRASGGPPPMIGSTSVSTTTPTHSGSGNAYFAVTSGHNDLELEFSSASATELLVEQFQVWQSTQRSHL